MHDIDDQLTQLRYLRGQPGLDSDVRETVQTRLDEISDLLSYLDADDGREQFIEDFIARERRRFVEGGRDDVLCRCSSLLCGFKRGYLPPEAYRRDARKRVRELHGDPIVYREASESWANLRGNVATELDRLVSLLESNDPETLEKLPQTPAL